MNEANDQSFEAEYRRLDYLWAHRRSTVLGEEYYPRGMSAGFGFVAVVRPSDYRSWWERGGKDRGAPDPAELTAAKTQ